MNRALKTKIERQHVSKGKFFNASSYGSHKNYDGVFVFCTGFGKTFTALLILNELFKTNRSISVVIVVNRENLVAQWNNRLDKYIKLKSCRKNIKVMISNTILNQRVKILTDFAIVDEYHEYYSDERCKIINGELIQSKMFLGLTATYKDPYNRHLNFDKIHPVIDVIEEDEALRNGWISKYIEFNLAVELSEKSKVAYDIYSKKVKESLAKFKHNFTIASDCLSGKKDKYTAEQCRIIWAKYNGWKPQNQTDPRDIQQLEINDMWNPKKIAGYAVTLMKNVRDRKNMLYNCDEKINVTIEIIKKFKVKTVSFGQSVPYAVKLATLVNNEFDDFICVAYYSKLRQKDVNCIIPNTIDYKGLKPKQKIIKAYNDNYINMVSAASALDSGMDTEDIKLAIIASNTSNYIQRKQRKGRAVRVDNNDINNTVIIVNLYVKGTKDEDWLRTSQRNHNNPIYFITSVDEIGIDPPETYFI